MKIACLGLIVALCLAVPARAQDVSVLELLRDQVIGLDSRLSLPDTAAPPCDLAEGPTVTRGLLIAASDWTADRRQHLLGPVNDAELLHNALVARGARAEHLHILTGADATRAGVEAAAAALVTETACGDSVILHVSGWAFGAELLAPSAEGGPPVAVADDAPTLAASASLGLGGHDAARVVALGPWVMLNAPDPGTAQVLSADALSDLVTRLRNRGGHVVLVLDTSAASALDVEGRQTAADPRPAWRLRLTSEDSAGEPLLPLSARPGGLTVFYGTDRSELTLEMRLPKGGPDPRYYGVFSFQMAAAILRAEVPTPAAIARLITEVDPGLEAQRRWTYLINSSEPDLPIVAEVRTERPATRGGQIRIIDPAPTRAAQALDDPVVLLRGQVEAAAGTMIVTVNGQVARSDPDGSFSFPLTLQAGVNRVDVLAMTRDNQPLTHSFELYFEGDMKALVGTGTRYALLIANQDYPMGSGLSPLQTPIADATALAEVLTRKFGFVTETTAADGQPLPLFLRNAGRMQIEATLYDLSRIVGERDQVLIFYAGHGIYEAATDSAYWLPVDARAGLPFSYLPASAITDAILRLNAGSVLVISDSCYSGALLRGDSAAEGVEGDRLRALQRLAAKRSRIAISSGANEPVADGGGEGHSVFARALLTGLQDLDEDAFTARELFDDYLLPMVVGRAAQEPQYRPIERSGHEGGDVVLVRAGG